MGWVVCIIDSIFVMKGDFWDMLIILFLVYLSNVKERVWLIIECFKGVLVKVI